MQKDARFDGYEFGFKISPDGLAEPLPPGMSDGTNDYWVWIAVDPKGAESEQWLRSEAGLTEHVAAALIAFDTRPRCLVSPDAALLILRGVNVDPKSDPTDLVSIRAWIEDNRVITVQHRKLATADTLRTAYDAGSGPNSSAELIVALAEGMIERMRTVVKDLEGEIDLLEDEALTGNLRALRTRLNAVRHRMVPLRRYLSPQRDAFVNLMNAKLPWLDDWWQSHLREITDEVHRYIEALDSIRESANIVQDTLNSRTAEETNRLIAVLSLGAAAFLPLNLFVGLLGANVAGIPGAQSPYAFYVVIGLLILLMLGELAIFRRLRLWRLLR